MHGTLLCIFLALRAAAGAIGGEGFEYAFFYGTSGRPSAAAGELDLGAAPEPALGFAAAREAFDLRVPVAQAGPLGLRLSDSLAVTGLVRPGLVERTGLVRPGDSLVRVGAQPVLGRPLAEVVALLGSAPRPVDLWFRPGVRDRRAPSAAAAAADLFNVTFASAGAPPALELDDATLAVAGFGGEPGGWLEASGAVRVGDVVVAVDGRPLPPGDAAAAQRRIAAAFRHDVVRCRGKRAVRYCAVEKEGGERPTVEVTFRAGGAPGGMALAAADERPPVVFASTEPLGAEFPRMALGRLEVWAAPAVGAREPGGVDVAAHAVDAPRDPHAIPADAELLGAFRFQMAAFGEPLRACRPRALQLAAPRSACAAVGAAAARGRVAVARRGDCFYAVKARNAFEAGAVGLVVVNSGPGFAGEVLAMPAGDTPVFDVRVPVLMAESGLVEALAALEGRGAWMVAGCPPSPSDSGGEAGGG